MKLITDHSSTHASLGVSVAIAWAQYGPYHFARLRAAQKAAPEIGFFGVEVASKTSTYAWNRTAPAELRTLLPGETAENASGLRTFLCAVRLFRRENVKVVFVPSYWPQSSLALLMAAKVTGAAIVMMNESHAHTARASGLRLRLKGWLIRMFDAALIGGGPQRSYFESMGIPAERIFDGYDVIDNDYYGSKTVENRLAAAELRNRYGLPNRYFLNVGRMVAKKNLDTLIRAYAAACAADPAQPRLVFVGSGPLEMELRENCVRLGLSFVDLRCRPSKGNGRPAEADVLFFGFRQADELPVFYSLATAFVLPSVREEWGLVINEAMACGLPVVVSKVVGCAPDLVLDGENGFQFDPDDVDELAERLRWLGENPDEVTRMGNRSREIIAEWDVTRFARNARKAAAAALGTVDSEP